MQTQVLVMGSSPLPYIGCVEADSSRRPPVWVLEVAVVAVAAAAAIDTVVGWWLE